MRNILKIFLIGMASVLILNSCEDILSLEPKDEISEIAVWNDANLINAYLAEVYFGLNHGVHQGNLDCITDNATAIPDLNTAAVHLSTITPGSIGGLNNLPGYRWIQNYDYIRRANHIIENIDNASISESNKNLIKGQALYLRAHFYHSLWKTHGGIPIVTKLYRLDDNDMDIARNSYEETLNFLVRELDAAANLLPTTWPDGFKGRATKGAAMALKSRVLLYAASDLYHQNPGGRPETGYIGSKDRTAFWRAAKNAAADVMNMGTYSLFRGNPAPGDSISENYYRLFLTVNNSETIFERYFTGSERHGRNANFTPNTYHGPNGFHQWGGTTPVQQLVDAFRMRDGSKFNWSNPEHASAPYKNRDPRFHATILYDGAKWMERSAAGITMDRDGVIQTFVELTLPDGTKVAGLDTRMSPIEDWNGTRSGYYLRKWVNQDLPLRTRQMPGIWIFIRYAEILLNYAEASIELGEEADARVALNLLRRRAGMPEFGTEITGAALKEEYRNERRVELTFEEHRFFDIRRWMIAPVVMNEPAQSILIYADATDRARRNTYSNYRYELSTHQNRSWNNKMYFFPIIQAEMDRNSNLVQNPGY